MVLRWNSENVCERRQYVCLSRQHQQSTTRHVSTAWCSSNTRGRYRKIGIFERSINAQKDPRITRGSIETDLCHQPGCLCKESVMDERPDAMFLQMPIQRSLANHQAETNNSRRDACSAGNGSQDPESTSFQYGARTTNRQCHVCQCD